MRAIQARGLPHSDTPGSIRSCRSPGSFAARRVLRRLRKPRHPPCALLSFVSCRAPVGTNPAGALGLVNLDPAPLMRGGDISLFLCSLSSMNSRFAAPGGRISLGTGKGPGIAGRDFSKKEVFQPHLPVRLPCYDLAPVTAFALGRASRQRTSGARSSHGLTGGVYKARERIHRAMADARLLANPTSRSRVAGSDPNWEAVSGSAPRRRVASRCPPHCNTCVAPDVRAVLI